MPLFRASVLLLVAVCAVRRYSSFAKFHSNNRFHSTSFNEIPPYLDGIVD